MSVFLRSLEPVDEAKIGAAGAQFDAMATVFNAMLSTCQAKCVRRDMYSEGELTKGEAACVDRCVAKMWTAAQLVARVELVSPAAVAARALAARRDPET